jgi:hypothetical protein
MRIRDLDNIYDINDKIIKMSDNFNSRPLLDKIHILKRMLDKEVVNNTNLFSIVETVNRLLPDRVDITTEFVPLFKTTYENLEFFYCDIEDWNRIVCERGMEWEMSIGEEVVHYLPSPSKIQIDKLVSLELRDVYLILHYPELTVSNAKKMSTIIYDMFVKIRLYRQYNFYKIEEIKGMRMSRTIKELQSGYVFSHLASLKYNDTDKELFKYTSFCFGDGQIGMIRSSFNIDCDLDLLESFIHMLENYLKWESLAGGPHIKMEDNRMKDFKYPDRNLRGIISDYNAVRDRILYGGIKQDINWVFNTTTNRYEIEDDEMFEDFLLEAKTGILFKTESGEYFQSTENTSIILSMDLSTEFIMFNGNKIYFKILDDIPEQATPKLYVHPKTKKYVKSRLEESANYALIKQSKIAI